MTVFTMVDAMTAYDKYLLILIKRSFIVNYFSFLTRILQHVLLAHFILFHFIGDKYNF